MSLFSRAQKFHTKSCVIAAITLKLYPQTHGLLALNAAKLALHLSTREEMIIPTLEVYYKRRMSPQHQSPSESNIAG